MVERLMASKDEHINPHNHVKIPLFDVSLSTRCMVNWLQSVHNEVLQPFAGQFRMLDVLNMSLADIHEKSQSWVATLVFFFKI